MGFRVQYWDLNARWLLQRKEFEKVLESNTGKGRYLKEA